VQVDFQEKRRYGSKARLVAKGFSQILGISEEWHLGYCVLPPKKKTVKCKWIFKRKEGMALKQG
jgi:hypothetical protein